LLEPRWDRRSGLNESPIGTAFYRFGEVNHDDCIDLRPIGYDLADNQIDTLTKAFQATTVACARCHDHKIDAVSSRDYYALLGVLRSSGSVAHTVDAPEINAEPMRRLRELKPLIRKEIAAAWRAEARDVGRYLLAVKAKASGLDAARLARWTAALAEKPAADDPFGPWRAAALAEEWEKAAAKWTKDEHDREAAEGRFTLFADFRQG